MTIEKWRKYLLKPDIGPEDGGIFHDDVFDPWEWFPSIYGSYSAEYDVCALDVILHMAAGQFENPQTLANQMFREMLCTSDIAEYGVSPRSCWFRHEIKRDEIELWVRKWIHYVKVQWGDLTDLAESAETAANAIFRG